MTQIVDCYWATREWLLLMWYGKREYTGYDFESGDLPLLVVGQINRKGIIHLFG